MIPGVSSRRRFSDLSEQEILALAISSEEDDAQIYRTYAHRLRAEFPPRPRSSMAWRLRKTTIAGG